MRTTFFVSLCVLLFPVLASANNEATLEAAMMGLTEDQENNILSLPVTTSFQLNDGATVQMLSLPATPQNVTGIIQKDGSIYEFSSARDIS